MRRPYTLEHYRRSRRQHRRTPAARVDRVGHDRRLSRRDRRGFRRERRATCRDRRCRTCTSFPYSDRPGHRGVGDGGPGGGAGHSRAGARGCARLARRWRGVSARRRSAPFGPGLTLEDGTLVVTDNYLKVRIPPGRARNERWCDRSADCSRRVQGPAQAGSRAFDAACGGVMRSWTSSAGRRPPRSAPARRIRAPERAVPGALVRADSVIS